MPEAVSSLRSSGSLHAGLQAAAQEIPMARAVSPSGVNTA
jgi:hypothetical protein